MSYEPWMLAAIDQAGYNGIRNEHISAVAVDLLHTGMTEYAGIRYDSRFAFSEGVFVDF